MDMTTGTGAKVVMNIGDWEDSMELQDALLSELAKSGLNIDLKNLKLSGEDSNLDVGQFLTAAMKLAGSKAIRESLFKCLVRCTYNKEKITTSTFQDETAREDYYEIAMACIKVNLSPFFKSALSRLKEQGLTLKSLLPK